MGTRKKLNVLTLSTIYVLHTVHTTLPKLIRESYDWKFNQVLKCRKYVKH